MIAAYRDPDSARGQNLMKQLIGSLASGVPAALTELRRLGRTLTKRAADVLAYFDRPGTSNGPTEAINGRLEHLYAAESMGYGFSYDDTAAVVSELCQGAFPEPVAEVITNDIATAVDAAGGSGEWLSGRRQDYLEWRWDLYSHNVKHTNRFVFPIEGVGNSAHPAPEEATELLHQIMIYVDGPLSLVRRFERGLSIFRGRLAENAMEVKHTAEALGPPPPAKAAANRMSPAGVSLFYGSEDPQAAIAEIAGHGPQPVAVVGEFRSTRALSILDLTSTPPPPGSVFDPGMRHAIAMWGFLRTFIRKVTWPVIPDSREHVEYAPTQVLTEYIRWMCRNQVDGIALPSGPGGGKKTYVLFIGPEGVADAPGELEHWLTLAPDAVTVYDIERTYEGLPRTPRTPRHPSPPAAL